MSTGWSAAQIYEDLHDVVRGELRFDPVHCALYSTDASILQVQPLGVVVPRDEDDVRAVVRYARERGLGITARGAGSGLAGESLNAGLILDFSRHFRDVDLSDPDRVRVQPGVVHRDLAERLAVLGRRFAPDPASSTQCTLGGMLGTNASGARALKHGYVRDHVATVRAVLSDGEAYDLGPTDVPATADAAQPLTELTLRLAGLLRDNEGLISACQPRTRFNRCGYLLHDLWHDGQLNLARLLVGSEGTLGLITAATLRTIPLPLERRVVFLGFPRLEAAANAVPLCTEDNPSACDLLDRRLLSLTCERYPEYEQVVSGHVQAALLVEFEGERPGQADSAAQRLVERCRRFSGLTCCHVSRSEAESSWLWQLRDVALPLLHALPGRAQPVPYLEDVAVPCDQLATLLHGMQERLQRHELIATFLVHAGASQVHARPFVDLSQPDAAAKLETLADEVYRLVLDLGGTISTQHGVGLARTPWVAQQYGRLYPVLREVKLLFDPNNILNPGKIVDLTGGVAGPGKTKLALRRQARLEPGEEPWRLRWKPLDVISDVNHCNGCGACRTEESGKRMCPLFRVDHDEAATPRAKANVLRSVLDGSLPRALLTSEDVRDVADLCINCKMCGIECPAGVNVPTLMLEAKAQDVAERGLRWGDWVLARTESFAALGSALAPLLNAFLKSHVGRWMLHRVLGIAPQRRLPDFAARSFLSKAARRGWTQPPRRPGVAYFVDVFANYNDPQIAEATVKVLHHNGIEVFVPEEQVGCGMAPLAYGDVDNARRLAEHNLRIFADLARAGYTILCSEPTAALMLRQDYRRLVDDPDVDLVASRTVELTSFLGRLQDQGRLRTDFNPLPFSIGHHVPCHVKALQTGLAGPKLLDLIPRLRAATIDVGCSGMAGTFGIKSENFETSLAVGRPMLERMRDDAIQFGSSECSPCRMQMEQGSHKTSLHPVQYLALAYGLMPEIARRLSVPKPRRKRRVRRR